MKKNSEKENFSQKLRCFTDTLPEIISDNDEWTIRGFIDIFKNVYTISTDTKIISKLLELHLFPHFMTFADSIGYDIEPAAHQNWYPDLTFISRADTDIKFAVDLKTTYRIEADPEFCNGFTLGSHGEYFINRKSTKNIQYPYGSYGGHFCLGIIYSRAIFNSTEELKTYTIDNIRDIPAVIKNFTFFSQEKWKIASDRPGSGNTANIGSIKNINDIISGNGTFANAGEELFDDYWANFGKIEIPDKDGDRKKLSSFAEYLNYRGLSDTLINQSSCRRKGR